MSEERDQAPAAPAPVEDSRAQPDEAPSQPAAEAAAEPAKASPPRPHRNPALVRAFRSRRPVQGTIVGVIKGGYEVKVGRSRGFCPHSQIDLHREDNPEQQVGKAYAFLVTQVRRGGEDVVVSRRALLEEQRVEEAKAVHATLVEGTVMQGHVASIADFGVFVDLGAGVLGLAHLSELSHQRIASPTDVVAIGQTVQVRVLKVDDERGRISLSLRQATRDPWEDVTERYRPGTRHAGTIARLAEFGAFVEVEPGVEALAPASEFPPAAGGWKSGLEVGAPREWVVLAVDARKRRISLALPGEAALDVALEAGVELTGSVQRVERFGVFVWLGPGKVGLMPAEWCGVPLDTELRRRFAIGQKIEVRIVEVADAGRKIRLARKGVEVRTEPEPRPAERQAREAPAQQQPQETGTFGSILGDKLRAVLGSREKG